MKFIDILKSKKRKNHFEEQISIVYKDLYKFIYSIIKNQNLAEDILQQTLMKAYEKFDTIQDIKKFKSWVFTIAKNESLSWIRKYNREIPSEDTYLELLAGSSEDIPEELLIKREIKEQIKESIKILNSVDQEIIYLRYYYDLSLKEIALILNLNENTVKTKHKRAKKQIYTHLICADPSFEVAAAVID
ncbi:RNA polymerase sigma factor [Clostridium tagluense]|uniref:RNA polymerase sigma factor n=1 Tax=Clostridium tagluense TaxID=360422 RepID=UPI001C6E5455|nr:RNA polymerase sigma factor [Clostridium tagluense]MBW9159475.1 RNA polymerase sigma factor [Clostridium tagluense]WLC68483.1 RNA polymerase sigma factor [Clostridium tagluense]